MNEENKIPNCPECGSEKLNCYNINYGTLYLECKGCKHRFQKSTKRALTKAERSGLLGKILS
jgi:transcription elongation factor Elf1